MEWLDFVFDVLDQALDEDRLLKGGERAIDAADAMDVLVSIAGEKGVVAPIGDVAIPVCPRQPPDRS